MVELGDGNQYLTVARHNLNEGRDGHSDQGYDERRDQICNEGLGSAAREEDAESGEENVVAGVGVLLDIRLTSVARHDEGSKRKGSCTGGRGVVAPFSWPSSGASTARVRTQAITFSARAT